MKILKDTLIILCLTLAILLVIELLLRFIYPEKASSEMDQAKEIAYNYNEDYLVALKPNMEKVFVRHPLNGGDTISWQTNNHSFRGGPLKQNPKLRAILYGDSNIQARFSTNENSLAGRLEKYLTVSDNTNVEVINAGVIGFGPDQSLIRYTKEADIYNPDLVIFHVFADNDFGDILRNQLFCLDEEGGLVRTNVDHKNISFGKNKNTKVESPLLIVRAAQKIAGKFFAVAKKNQLFKILQQSSVDEYSNYMQGKWQSSSLDGDHYDIDIALDPEAESSKLKIKLMKEILKEAHALSVSKGITFLVLIQPSVIDLEDNYYDFSYKYLEQYPAYKKTNLTDAVENICKTNNIECINLFNVFKMNNPDSLYFVAGDNHWNDKGQGVAANEIASYIMDHELLNQTLD